MTKYLPYKSSQWVVVSLLSLNTLSIGLAQRTPETTENSPSLTYANLGMIDRALYGCISGEM